MLDDPEKIVLTQKTVIPTFLRIAFDKVLEAEFAWVSFFRIQKVSLHQQMQFSALFIYFCRH